MRGCSLLVRTLIALAASSGGWGCRGSYSWSIFGQPRPSPHEQAATRTADSPATPTPTPTPAAAAGYLASPAAVRTVRLAFEVLRIHLPVDTVRHSRKIWNHVDELRLDTELVPRLARNGIRAGAVSPSAWPAIQTILDACEAEVRRDRWEAQGGLPLSIEVGAIEDSESIFAYDPGNRLVGKTFDVGDKLVNVDYGVRAELGGCVDLGLAFEIRHDRGVMTWERRGGILRQVPAIDRHVFTDLSAMLTLNAGEALMIGPSAEARNEYLVGSRFFVNRQSDHVVETLYCITPLPYRLPETRRQ